MSQPEHELLTDVPDHVHQQVLRAKLMLADALVAVAHELQLTRNDAPTGQALTNLAIGMAMESAQHARARIDAN